MGVMDYNLIFPVHQHIMLVAVAVQYIYLEQMVRAGWAAAVQDHSHPAEVVIPEQSIQVAVAGV
jgi:hypothetical protein